MLIDNRDLVEEKLNYFIARLKITEDEIMLLKEEIADLESFKNKIYGICKFEPFAVVDILNNTNRVIILNRRNFEKFSEEYFADIEKEQLKCSEKIECLQKKIPELESSINHFQNILEKRYPDSQNKNTNAGLVKDREF